MQNGITFLANHLESGFFSGFFSYNAYDFDCFVIKEHSQIV